MQRHRRLARRGRERGTDIGALDFLPTDYEPLRPGLKSERHVDRAIDARKRPAGHRGGGAIVAERLNIPLYPANRVFGHQQSADRDRLRQRNRRRNLVREKLEGQRGFPPCPPQQDFGIVQRSPGGWSGAGRCRMTGHSVVVRRDQVDARLPRASAARAACTWR